MKFNENISLTVTYVAKEIFTSQLTKLFMARYSSEFNGVSIFRQETEKESHPGLNFVHTERPHWATKPAQSKPSTDFSKPYFSIKTTTYRPISSQPDHRPNFISRPNWVLSTKTSTTTTTTTVRPTYARQPSTRYATRF